jgi:hypothetical protein
LLVQKRVFQTRAIGKGIVRDQTRCMTEGGKEPVPCSLSRALQVIVAGMGAVLLAAALAANQAWLDRHFLPLFFFSREKFLLQETLIRIFVGLAGLGLIFLVRPAMGRLAQRIPAREIAATAIRIVLAVGLAFAAAEFFLARKFVYAAAETINEEPLRRPDPRLGWTFKPARQGQATVGGRVIVYIIDAHGYRVGVTRAPVDTNIPTVLFTGESIMAGYGLHWDETISAQVGAMSKKQTANMAVFGYATDQAYLRLKTELPRFRKPVALVSLFTPALFVRNLGDDQPHLGPDLDWQPAVHHFRLSSLFRFLVPYHSEAEIERGIQATRAVLMATAALAREHHAISLVVDPQFGPEQPAEQMLRRRILDEPGVEYVRVELDPAWRLHGDLHPDSRAAHAIAAAIVQRLGAGER